MEGAPTLTGRAPYLVGTSCASRTLFSCTIPLLVGKKSLYNLPKVLTTVSCKYTLPLFRAVFLTDLEHHDVFKHSQGQVFQEGHHPYLAEVPHHPQTIEMREGVLHIRDVEGPRSTGSVETKLEAMEQQVFKCQGMLGRGLNANQMMIAEFTNNHKLYARNIGGTIFKLHEKIEHLQAQICDLQNKNCEYEYRFKRMSLAVDLRIPETRSSFYDGESMPWKTDDKPTSSTIPSSPPPRT